MSVVDGLPFNDSKKEYILNVLDPVLEELVGDVLADYPKEPLDYMIQWLRRRSGMPATSRFSVVRVNEDLQRELKQCTDSLAEVGTVIGGKPEEHPSEDEDNECEEPPSTFMEVEATPSMGRKSVSAEAYGDWNKKKAFKPLSNPKTDEQKTRLNTTLMKSFMFSDLESWDMDTLLMAMKEMTFELGTKVIAEGEDGDFMFVIEKGELECTKLIEGENKVVKTCVAGDVFGELALLYNCPRAATVSAKDTCVCWQLDRETFNFVVKDAAVKRREMYEGFLRSVPLISGLSVYERSQVAEALKPETFKKEDVIVRQNEPGDKFYIVEVGNLYALKAQEGCEDNRVMDYKAGDYFGELALLKNQPRAASVVVASETCRVLSMSRAAFSKMLGPLHSILVRQVANYS